MRHFFFQTGYYGNLIHCHHSNQIHVLEVQITQNNIGGKVNTVRERKVAVAGAFHVYLVFLIYYPCQSPITGLSTEALDQIPS